jgi:hypothetical protein
MNIPQNIIAIAKRYKNQNYQNHFERKGLQFSDMVTICNWVVTQVDMLPDFSKYYAFYEEPEDEDDDPKWYIVEKSFYDEHKRIDDQHLDLEIPGFDQCMESCFVCMDGLPVESQQVNLEVLGFEIK